MMENSNTQDNETIHNTHNQEDHLLSFTNIPLNEIRVEMGTKEITPNDIISYEMVQSHALLNAVVESANSNLTESFSELCDLKFPNNSTCEAIHTEESLKNKKTDYDNTISCSTRPSNKSLYLKEQISNVTPEFLKEPVETIPNIIFSADNVKISHLDNDPCCKSEILCNSNNSYSKTDNTNLEESVNHYILVTKDKSSIEKFNYHTYNTSNGSNCLIDDTIYANKRSKNVVFKDTISTCGQLVKNDLQCVKIITQSSLNVTNITRNSSLQEKALPNMSSEIDSISSDELIDLEVTESAVNIAGYQDNPLSHSQQNVISGSSGGGPANATVSNSNSSSAVIINGNTNSGYISLIPPAGVNSNNHPNGSSGTGGSASSGNNSGEVIDFKHLFEELCPVCGDKVSGYHYGLLTCESCKGFFKRTVQNKKVYTCVAERSCHIDKTQRKRCPYCRFQKCLEVGMKLEAVRADRMRGGRNKFGPMYKRDRARKLQVMRQRQLALQALRTSIGSTELKTGPLSPNYQQAYPNMNIKQEIQIPQVSSLTQSPDSSPSPIAIALGQVNQHANGISNSLTSGNVSNGANENISEIMNRGGSSSCHDGSSGHTQHSESKLCFDSSTHPSSTADSVSSIEPLRVSPMIRDFVQSIDDREWQTQLFALLQKQTYNQVEVDLFELMCKVLDQNLFSQVDWARNTVFFKDLKVDDQMKLLQNSWSDMLVLDHLHQRIHNGLPDETQLNNGQVFNLLGLGLLGVPQLSDYFNELQNKLQELKFDMGDYVCMKFLILLNPNVRGIINKKTVLEGHENVQAALLDYTLTCYPSVTDKFSRLLNILPEIHAMAARGEEHLYSKHCAGSAPTQTLLMEMLHAKRKV